MFCDSATYSLLRSVRHQAQRTCWQLSEAQVLHGAGGDQRFLRVVQHVGQRVHPHVEVGDVDAHGLFTHS